MKKIIGIILVATCFIVGCTKSNSEIITQNSNERILIKVDAEHIDGDIISSQIVVVY